MACIIGKVAEGSSACEFIRSWDSTLLRICSEEYCQASGKHCWTSEARAVSSGTLHRGSTLALPLHQSHRGNSVP
eukprot:12410055-Karenia_brevis.AAC.1